jgi:hypothetical protein
VTSSSRGRSRAFRALLSLAVPVALVLAGPAAEARPLRLADATHDVVTVDPTVPRPVAYATPAVANGDIRRVFVHYRTGRLVIRTDFVALAPRTDTVLSLGGAVRTDDHRLRVFTLVTSPSRYAGHDELLTARGRSSCEIGHFIDYRRDFARVVVPLACLDGTRWVRISLSAVTLTFDPATVAADTPDDLLAHVDDATGDLSDSTGWTPRVYR